MLNKSRYLIAIFLVIAASATFGYSQIKDAIHHGDLSQCITNLKKLEKEVNSNPKSVMIPFQVFPVNEKNRYKPTMFGYKDSKGHIVMPATFTQARDFSESKAAVADKNWYWGFIDLKGQLTIPYQFSYVSDYYGGVAAFVSIRGDKDKSGFIDQNGKIVVTLDDNGGYFASDFYGFENGYVKSSRWAWDPLGMNGNPHPTVSISIDCTGRVVEQ